MTDLFAQITFPELLGLKKLGIGGSALAVWLGLRIHDSVPGGDCRPSQERLAHRLGLDYRAVKRSIKKLREVGLIAQAGRNGRVAVWELNIALVHESAKADAAEKSARDTNVPKDSGNGDTNVLIEDGLSGHQCPLKTKRGHERPHSESDGDTNVPIDESHSGHKRPYQGSRGTQTSLSEPNKGTQTSRIWGQKCPTKTNNKNVNNSQIHNSQLTEGDATPDDPDDVRPPDGDGVDSPAGDFQESKPKPAATASQKPAVDLAKTRDHLLAQSWWLSTSSAMQRSEQTASLLRDYVAKWPPESVLLWVTVATHPKSGRIRRGSEGAFVFAHLRGYGRNGWNPENKSSKERELHAAILRCDEPAALKALELEASYAPENKARARRDAESKGDSQPDEGKDQTGSTAAMDRAADEASSCLGDIPGWMLNAPGADHFEKQRNRVHATRALAGRLAVRCKVAAVADVLLSLFRSEQTLLQANGITAASVQSALEAESLGKPPHSTAGMPLDFWGHVLDADYKLSTACLTKRTPSKALME